MSIHFRRIARHPASILKPATAVVKEVMKHPLTAVNPLAAGAVAARSVGIGGKDIVDYARATNPLSSFNIQRKDLRGKVLAGYAVAGTLAGGGALYGGYGGSVTSIAKTVGQAAGYVKTGAQAAKTALTAVAIVKAVTGRKRPAGAGPGMAASTAAARSARPSFFSQRIGGSGFMFNFGQLLRNRFAFLRKA